MKAWRGRCGVGVWPFHETCSWDSSVIILTYWNLLTILHIESKAAKGKEGMSEDRCASVTEARRLQPWIRAQWRKGDSKLTDPCYTSLPGVKGRWERSFCQCHNEERGWGLPGDIWGGKKSGWIDSRKREGEEEHQDRKGGIVEGAPPPLKILLPDLQQMHSYLFNENKF